MSKGKTKTKNHNKKKKKKKQRIGHAHVQVHVGIFVIYLSDCSNFLSILERKYFGRPEEKTSKPHKFFSLPFLQPNTHQKSFSSHFLSKVFHPPISLPNNHTLELCYYHCSKGWIGVRVPTS